jgi:hypothetical protein
MVTDTDADMEMFTDKDLCYKFDNINLQKWITPPANFTCDLDDWDRTSSIVETVQVMYAFGDYLARRHVAFANELFPIL